jgi:aspartate/methionine/tyrosine aminotransferase
MELGQFELERYFSRYEFSARYLLASSDCESVGMSELLAWADDECRELWGSLRLGYTESPGLPLLRAAIAGMYDGVAPDEVLEIVPEEGIFLAMNALLRPGDHVIVTWPGYQSLFSLAETIGCEVTFWEPDEAQGWRFDPAAVRGALRPTTRLIVANFPHNPTGHLPTREEYEELIAVAAEAGAFLFSDEMYRWLEQDAGRRLPSAVERYDKAVILCGLSKTFALPGLRVGWLASRDAEALGRIAAAKDFTTICGSAPSEILALIGVRNAQRLIERSVRITRDNLDRLDGFFGDWTGLFTWQRPRAGSIGLARLHAAEGAPSFCARLVEQAGVLLAPSTVFGYGGEHVRFGFGRANLPEAVAALDAWLRAGG